MSNEGGLQGCLLLGPLRRTVGHPEYIGGEFGGPTAKIVAFATFR